MKAQQEVLEFLEVHLKEHERTYDASVTRDYIDAFLSEMKKNEGNGESTFTCEFMTLYFNILLLF